LHRPPPLVAQTSAGGSHPRPGQLFAPVGQRKGHVSFVKIFSQLAESSIAEAELHTRWLWVVLLTKCDRFGHVYGTISALARMANLPLEQTQAAIDDLMRADPRSTSPEYEGRRIISESPNVWYVVNYIKYRNLKDPDEERERERLKKAGQRAKRFFERPPVSPNVPMMSPKCPPQEEVEVEKTKDSRSTALTYSTSSDEFLSFWKAYPRRVGKVLAAKSLAKALRLTTLPVILSALARCIDGEWRNREPEFIPHPSTWLNQGRWEDEPEPEPSGPSKEHLFAVDAAIAKMGGYPSE